MDNPKTKILKAEIHINNERCKGCSFCIEFCPRQILYQSGEINSKGYHLVRVKDSEKCTGCGLCSMFCPEFAIHVESHKGKGQSAE